MHTTLFLVRHGETEWERTRRVAGRRDLGLTDLGLAQAAVVTERLAGLEIAEILSSPLVRAFDTAELISKPHGIEVGRDPRLTDVNVGRWEGKTYREVEASPEYVEFLRGPRLTTIPGGESLVSIRDRVVASVEQALEGNELGSNIVVISHAIVVRVLLAHYLGKELGHYHRLRVTRGSLSLLRYDTDRELPRVLAINHGATLDEILQD